MANILHRVKAFLYPNELTPDPDDYSARVSSERTLDIADVCRSAVSRGGAPGTFEAMEQQVRNFLKEMAHLSCDGFSINTGYFTLDTQLRGVFNREDERYDPEKHTLYFRYHQGELMRQLIPEIEVQMMGLGDVQPTVKDVTDVKTGALNSAITSGKAIKVRGTKIKLTGEHPDTGIFFVAGSGERTRVENDEIITNNPSELTVMVPLLPAGTYRLEVVTQYSGGALLLKEPRIAVFSKPLTVV